CEQLEAEFCEGCEREDLSPNASVIDVMKEVVAMAEKQEERVKDELKEVKNEYDRAQIPKRVAVKKQRRCEGYWNEDDQVYEEYDTEERLDCKMAKLLTKPFIEKDRYYQETLKRELWQEALSDEGDPYLIMDHLKRIRANPYGFSQESRNSVTLLENYIGWRDRYENAENDYQRNFVINRIVDRAEGLSDHLGNRGQEDFLYLRTGLDKHFDMAGARLNSVMTRATSPTSHTPVRGTSSPHHPINQETLNLY
ncbi:MAG: hypothetical protein OXB86_00750, partial [Bdellovibrionales bacterium]|nr:hypothetical protein [Bdellovibrionales bacterium]